MKLIDEPLMPDSEVQQREAFVRACLDQMGLDDQRWVLYAEMVREAYTAGWLRGKGMA